MVWLAMAACGWSTSCATSSEAGTPPSAPDIPSPMAAQATETVATVIYLGRRRLPDGRVGRSLSIYTSDPHSPYLGAGPESDPRLLGKSVSRVVKRLGSGDMGKLMQLLRKAGFLSIPPEDWTQRVGMGTPGADTAITTVRPALPDNVPAIYILQNGRVSGLRKIDLSGNLGALKSFTAAELALIKASRWL